MCSAYWNLRASYACPKCGAEIKDDQLQTHFMGEPGSCMNEYQVGDKVDELSGISAPSMVAAGDDLIGICDDCDITIDLDAEIVDGQVVRVWPYQYRKWQDMAWVSVTVPA